MTKLTLIVTMLNNNTCQETIDVGIFIMDIDAKIHCNNKRHSKDMGEVLFSRLSNLWTNSYLEM